MSDNVNHPSHYETGKFECIDVMLETQGYLATLGFCICNMFKYTYRHGSKNGREDIEKAGWYRDKYLELLDRESEFIKDRDDIANDLRKMLPSAYARLVTGTPIPEPLSVLDNDLDARLAPSGEYVHHDGSGVPDGMCAIKDIPEVQKQMDDFSKKMNPPIEDGPQINPDENGWYDCEHLSMLDGYEFCSKKIKIPLGKSLETVVTNGVSLMWHKGDDILLECLYQKNCGQWYRILTINGIPYNVTKARIVDAPESLEEVSNGEGSTN